MRARPFVARLSLSLSLLLGMVLGLTACSDSEPGLQPESAPSTSSSPEASAGTDEQPEAEEAEEQPEAEPAERARPTSVLGIAELEHRGDRLRLGAVREQTSAYTSYDVTYRSRTTGDRGTDSYTISGVLNVPTGNGPFPAVVLAHGYIDPAVYVRGQGMTRERGVLASRGYIALHVDYRQHAESDDDPDFTTDMRLGYSSDVINAVKALRNANDVPVDDDRIAYFGRSMGGGVVLKALIAEPGLVQAAAPWASVSSLEADNYRQFMGDPEDTEIVSDLRRRFGTPDTNPGFWRENSSRPYFEAITEPVLMVHGRFDDTCPPEWARSTQRALTRAGVDSQLQWYDDGHAFGPSFNAAMDRTITFFDNQLR